MEIGKLTSQQLKEIIFDKLKNNRKEVIARPGIGEDCAVIDYGENVCVMSSDPITGTAKNIGKLAVHITCNDIASEGVAPLGIMLTIMLPPHSTEEDIKSIMEDAIEEAQKLDVDILGGHTEVTDAVNRIVISSTGIGLKPKADVYKAEKIMEGDLLILTKGAGIEGTGIICFEREDELKKAFGEETVEEGKALMDYISVITEGVIGGQSGAKVMHDVTEGGVLGGVWELCELAGLGCSIWMDKIHIHRSTSLVCKHYNIDPLRLISSGSMLMVAGKDKAQEIIGRLEEKGIGCSIIGRLEKCCDKKLVDGGKVIDIDPPASDELYKVV
ncbi:Hydrogenase maturation factor [Peptoclostridium litorale DSM 5388]|uniref:Putative hydrogenase expression/formation protein n=1 Tax=Peptoclostridium litorale DSM 5388 TaxID=1121324 RepID=A0A069RF99_PEPLI|nr:AIR synthase family protein [Peptoclostridium litorale]KDR95676.1 putative hydrogenase expression/formation protein [Peptoclostridium litorale DSM 5388]SIO00853.1 Hydrogenase maturation factor [Peptoclostridium litorale DSM 5388]